MRLQEILIEADRTMVQGPHPSTVVFADLAGFTVLTQEIGDAPAAERAAEFEALAHEVAVAKGGRLIKALGDGVMLLFGDAPSAAEAAIHLAAGASTLPPARIGLATGVIVPRDGDVFGRTVNMAARICAKARTNEVLVCEVTRAVIENAVPGAFTFAALDPVELKGFSAPVELYQTRALRPIAFGWQTTGDTPAHVSPTM
ncbi:hypothetical protein MGN01_20460 [Methylobacterium gnaphalii]|uniref:Guanylate cyclase domain-containing protein n=2 Tax=Methylobacterium gnaphalii TaxID=1010610 RepID=A0A512JJS0_9HYPH|nr:hypothetical protein MGN01_20460 [Methylobacterium gnaphalii]GLS48718.1 hypothetical protein GCM10007885_15620 [Methylobacterium gnaphalii]